MRREEVRELKRNLERLKEIVTGIDMLLLEADEILELSPDGNIAERARTFWLSLMFSCLYVDKQYKSGALVTLEDTIREIENLITREGGDEDE